MTISAWIVAAGIVWAQSSPQDLLFAARTDLQGMYDESSQAAMQFLTDTDVDQFHDVLCTPDYVFVDAAGKQHSWSDVRADEVRMLTARPDALTETIDKVALVPGGASTTVIRRAVRTIVDTDARYGRAGAHRTVTETTMFRDAWVKNGDAWKLRSRQQLDQPKVAVS